MKDFAKVRKNLEKLGYSVMEFDTSKEALEYLDSTIDGQSVGFGGSETVMEMGLYDALSKHNTAITHHRGWNGKTQDEMRALAAGTDIYISSVNGLSEDGEIINIDGRGNRLASTLFGHKKIIFVVGENKIESSYEKALWRARNIAGPKNAKRLGMKTPCAVNADRCYNCSSEDRICRALLVLWEKPMDSDIQVILIHENLGF